MQESASISAESKPKKTYRKSKTSQREFIDSTPFGEGAIPMAKIGSSELKAQRDRHGYWEMFFSPHGAVPKVLQGRYNKFNDMKVRVYQYCLGVL